MDKTYEEYYLSTRLRTRKQKERLMKEDFDKYMLWVERRFDKLSHLRDNTYYERLPKPVQRGWVRTFELTNEAKQMPDVVIYQQILDRLNTRQYSNYPIFNDKLGKRRQRRLKRTMLSQELGTLRTEDYAELDAKTKRMFVPNYEYNLKCGKPCVRNYSFKYPWLFKLVVIPNMVDKVQRLNAEVEVEYAYYDKVLYLHYNRLIKHWGYIFNDYHFKREAEGKARKSFRNMPKWKFREMLMEEA